MPSSPRGEYNPIVLGFVQDEGPVSVPLQVARERYGLFPSEFGLLSTGAHRRMRKTLNLSLGVAILAHLKAGGDLRETLARFYERWGRDFHADFRVRLEPLLRRNDPLRLKRVLEANQEALAGCRGMAVRDFLRAKGLIPPATLASIPDGDLLAKASGILAKRLRNPAHRGEREAIAGAQALVEARRRLDAVAALVRGDVLSLSPGRLAVHADEVSQLLWGLGAWLPLAGVEGLEAVRGEGLEFEFAPRDASFLALGKEVGDCTADKSVRQVDRDVENIYWTVFAWFLDRQYQILKVYWDGDFIMKVHLLPVHVVTEAGEATVLAVDAIETAPAFREDTRLGRPSLLERKAELFREVLAEVVRLARAMGIEQVYAERFSNAAWVRRELEQLPEIYLRIGDIRKIDELEDVFELARRVCASAEAEPPTSVFMELQMKNAFLQPGVVSVKGIKPFAVVAGDAALGIPMKRAFGV
ncbi:MAG: hypothetical protein ACE147_13210 [Candidatus Methylomirabilales bacterium]